MKLARLIIATIVALVFVSTFFAAEQQSPCAVCEIVVQVTENYLEQNATQAEIEQALDKLCNDLPSPYNSACVGIVEQYLEQIIQFIEDDEPPQTLCAQLQLCSSATVVETRKREVQQSPCAVCEIVAQVVETYLENNATEREIQKKLDQVCNDFPAPYNGECTLIVNSYLTEIIQWLQNNETPQAVCQQLSLCPKEEEQKREVQQNVCAVCELIVQVAESYVEQNATEREIKQKLDQVCRDLPSPYNGECVLIVNAYLSQIIKWLENNEPPHTLCTQLALCSYKRDVVVEQAKKRAVQQSPCAVCEIVVQVAENYLEQNKTVAEIEQKLDQVCNDLPSPYNGECTLIVEAYLPQIIEWLQNDEPPATLCAQLSLCSSQQKRVERRDIQQSPCAVCEIVVQVAENYLNNNSSFSELEAKVDQVCDDLPAPYNGECVLIAAAYLPQIVAWIDANEQPATFCGQVGLCQS